MEKNDSNHITRICNHIANRHFHRREIYVEGEIYLDVTPDKSRPFVVKTHQFNVEVLGTSFTVNAYKGKKQSEVVLVEGSVRLSDKYQKEVLMLSLIHILTYNKFSKNETVSK